MKKSRKIAKKIVVILVVLTICILEILFFNYLISDHNIIKGYYKKEEHFDPFATQDSVDYCKYYYTSEFDTIFSNKYKKILQEDIPEIKEYFNVFKGWMEAGNRLVDYDFDANIIDDEDFCLLYDKSDSIHAGYSKFGYFSIHFYDTNSHTLYYVHANI